jgi:hypothetical protein
MREVVGEILPLALGVAISPIPIIAAILMLLSPKAKATSIGFLIGWLGGIVVAVVVFVLLASFLPQDSDQSSPVAGVIKIVLGGLMLLVAGRQWQGRPHGDEEPTMPTWMSAIDSMSAGKAMGLGFLLAAVNPKNLLMAVSAGAIIGTAQLTLGSVAGTVAIFTALAGCTVAVPVIGYLLASKATAGPLESLRGWMVHNNATIMAVLLLVIGVNMIGKGIASF